MEPKACNKVTILLNKKSTGTNKRNTVNWAISGVLQITNHGKWLDLNLLVIVPFEHADLQTSNSFINQICTHLEDMIYTTCQQQKVNISETICLFLANDTPF